MERHGGGKRYLDSRYAATLHHERAKSRPWPRVDKHLPSFCSEQTSSHLLACLLYTGRRLRSADVEKLRHDSVRNSVLDVEEGEDEKGVEGMARQDPGGKGGKCGRIGLTQWRCRREVGLEAGRKDV